jgi:hypothetical protein
MSRLKTLTLTSICNELMPLQQFFNRRCRMRFFPSGLRIFHGLTRPGISIDPEDMRSSLPPWRRYEYREALKAWAAKYGKPMPRRGGELPNPEGRRFRRTRC